MAGLPRRVRSEFDAFTGRDQGARLLNAMAVWTDAAAMDPAAFRRTVVGATVPEAGAAMQAMGRSMRQALAASGDAEAHAAVGEHLAAALDSLRPHEFRHDLASVQDQAMYAAVNGLVPDRPPLPSKAPDLSITIHPYGNDAAAAPPMAGPALAETLGILATRLAPAAFGEAAAALLGPLSLAALAALVLYLLSTSGERPSEEGLALLRRRISTKSIRPAHRELMRPGLRQSEPALRSGVLSLRHQRKDTPWPKTQSSQT